MATAWQSGASATHEMAALSRIVGFVDARNNEVFRFFIGPALMWDLWCALALEAWRARAGKVAFGWFRALAELEALSSMAGFAFAALHAMTGGDRDALLIMVRDAAAEAVRIAAGLQRPS